MNKLTIISISIFFFGLFAIHALALDDMNDLSASEFFYSESAVNRAEVVDPEVFRIKTNAGSATSDLTASEFFYGQSITHSAEITNNADFHKRSDVAAPSGNLITPEAFYGYTDVLEDKDAPCSKC